MMLIVRSSPMMEVLTHHGGAAVPNRRHSRSANQGKASYHLRIQKKWNRRFGTHLEPIMKPGEVLVFNGMAIADPATAHRLRQVLGGPYPDFGGSL